MLAGFIPEALALLRVCVPSSRRSAPLLIFTCLFLSAALPPVSAQQTNPVDRKVTNPITDTPNVNPLTQEQPVRPRTPARRGQAGEVGEASDLLKVDAGTQTVSGPENARIFVYEGNVDARIGTYRLQADKVTVYEATNKVVAEGNVVFDQANSSAHRLDCRVDYRTKTGFFLNSMVSRIKRRTGRHLLHRRQGRVSLARSLRPTHRSRRVTKTFKMELSPSARRSKRVIACVFIRLTAREGCRFFTPDASVSIKRAIVPPDFSRQFGGSGQKGFRFSGGYFQTLGRSADVTIRNDIYTSRGIGFGADLRTRANSRSFFNAGFYVVKDRVLGHKEDADHPDQGGSSIYVEGVHYFPNGFIAAADVNITSNLAYRQVFSDSIQQAISPEERSQVS